jgi:hypothetical protein
MQAVKKNQIKSFLIILFIISPTLLFFQNCSSSSSGGGGGGTSGDILLNPITSLANNPFADVGCANGCDARLLRTSLAELSSPEGNLNTSGVIVDQTKLRWEEILFIDPARPQTLEIKWYFNNSIPQVLNCSYSFEGISRACEDDLTLPISLASEGLKNLDIYIRTVSGDFNISKRVAIYSSSADSAVQLSPEHRGNFYLDVNAKSEAATEINQVWVGQDAALYMQGKNFCVNLMTPYECRIIIGSGGRFYSTGSNIAPGSTPEQASLFLGRNAVAIIDRSNVNLKKLRIVPDATIISLNSSGSKVFIESLEVLGTDFDPSTCPFSIAGGCPANLQHVQ